jgi:serine/threonine protein kinase
VPYNVGRPAKRLGCFFRGHPPEVTHFDQLGQRLVFSRERIQSTIQIQKLHLFDARTFFRLRAAIQRKGRIPIALLSGSGSRVVHQHLSHHSRRHRQEMDTVRESALAIADKFEVCLIDQRRSLQRVACPLSSQVPRRDPVQFVIERLHQIVEHGFITRAQLLEQLRYARRHAHQGTSFNILFALQFSFVSPMSPEVQQLFHELADLPPAEREKVFRDRHIGSELRAEVESLLGYDSTNQQYLTDRVSRAAEDLLHSVDVREQIRCGPYKLVRLLGSGGMGAVYLAERTDGEIQQRVAVKLLRAGERRDAWHDRFLNERQLLASLSHPSIVHVIDAGHTEDGRPYLVMEYVDGQPIDLYAANIDLRDRLRLFLRVCEGVSHAHHHLIIHRDLKPSNILVGSSGQPKLLDFGIAKLLDQTGEATQTVERLLTPSYASPEQLIGEIQTTATDIYSLGAVLHKLLTNAVPSDSMPPSRLNPDVPRDLDFIISKALRQEPQDRYISVEAFAADIRAFLESRPVEARSGNTWYRARKFLRRYWIPVAAAVLVIASLAGGLYVANRQRVIAERRFGQLRQLSNKVFELDKAIRNLPGSIEARQRLVSASLEYLEGLAADAHGNIDLAQEIGDAYERVAEVQGVPIGLNLGEFGKAEASLARADAFIDMVLAARPELPRALYRSASIAEDRMILAQSEHRRADALSFARKSSERLEAFLNQPGAQESDRANAARIYANIGLAHINMHLYAEGVRYAQRAVDQARSLHRNERAGILLSSGLSLLANAYRYQGDLEAALRAIDEAWKIAEETVYPNQTERMVGLYGILLRQGLILGEDGSVNLDRPAEAIKYLQKAFDITAEAARQNPNDFASRSRFGTCALTLANILRYSNPERAIAIYDAAISRLGEIPNNLSARRDKASALANSSYALRRLHRASESKQRIEAAFAILKETKDYPAERIPFERMELYNAFTARADHEAQFGDPHRAVADYEELLAKVIASKPETLTDLRDVPRISSLYESLSRLYRRTGNINKANDMESLRLDLWRHWDTKLPNNVFVRRELEAARLP